MNLLFQTVDELVEALLLQPAYRFACKCAAVNVSIAGESARARNDLAQRVTLVYLIDSRCRNLPFQTHELALLGNRHLDIVFRKHRDDIARRERQIMPWIALENRLAKIER